MSAVCALDAGGRVSLQQILQAFNSNVSEEHAWALCHQAARCFQRCLSSGTSPPPACFLPTRPSHLLLHADGSVHPDTLLDPTDDSSRPRVKSEYEVVVSLGLVVYRALDHTHGDDEERLISPDLEALISDMTLSNGNLTEEEECGLSESLESVRAGDTDDEGIERDAEPPRVRQRRLALFLLEDVIERCAWHAGVGRGRGARETAAAHYRAVCRALVAEALELASFLARVRVTAARDLGAADDSASHLDTLQFSDWSNRRIWRALQARFWMQVIGELRMGVKLKKVSHSRTPIEYELTPYEILMDDIRSRRYKLRKVDSSIPHNVKKDAHAMILEFIRSRPPLKKASERQLPPAKRETTPREQLLRSIRLGRPLRPTPRVNIERRKSEAKVRRRRVSPVGGRSPDEPPLDVAQHKAYWGSVARARPRTEASGSVSGGASEDRRAGSDVTRRTSGDVTPHTQPRRRLIKVDFNNLEDDEDDEETEKCASPPRPLPRHSAPPKPWKRTASRPRVPPRARLSHDEYHQFCDETLESYDLATQCPSRRASVRRHSVANAATGPTGAPGAQSVPHSRPESRGSIGGLSDDAESSWSRSSLRDDLVESKRWRDALLSEERLSLTLEEIVHIRSVLTKAELEVLPVEGRVKEDVEKRRVCFLCLKTRFGIFGPWGQRCKLCKRTVCHRCCTKMRIPTEHFAHVPVVLLSPSLLPSPTDEEPPPPPRSLLARLAAPGGSVENSVGSAPSSPGAPRRAAASEGGGSEGGGSAPGSRGGSALGWWDGGAMTRSVEGPASLPAAERLRGVPMAVCLDCKALVLQIIKSSRACRSAERDRALRHLTLDLTPLYPATDR
ncbi:protein spire isoform X2 [Pieris rapae]|uniref:protein spire isoform X2 n=1 Tax=Pieris rapae TaxID=64459 RepID=UPI001E27E078|nr:protein spire isoform X2 [Pieris rapae]